MARSVILAALLLYACTSGTSNDATTADPASPEPLRPRETSPWLLAATSAPGERAASLAILDLGQPDRVVPIELQGVEWPSISGAAARPGHAEVAIWSLGARTRLYDASVALEGDNDGEVELPGQVVGLHAGPRFVVFSSDGDFLWELAREGALPSAIVADGEILEPGTMTLRHLDSGEVRSMEVQPGSTIVAAHGAHVYLHATIGGRSTWSRLSVDGVVEPLDVPDNGSSLLAVSGSAQLWIDDSGRDLIVVNDAESRTRTAPAGWQWAPVGTATVPSSSARMQVVDPLQRQDALVGLTRVNEFGHPERWRLVRVALTDLIVVEEIAESPERLLTAYWPRTGPVAIIERERSLFLWQAGDVVPLGAAGVYAGT